MRTVPNNVRAPRAPDRQRQHPRGRAVMQNKDTTDEYLNTLDQLARHLKAALHREMEWCEKSLRAIETVTAIPRRPTLDTASQAARMGTLAQQLWDAGTDDTLIEAAWRGLLPKRRRTTHSSDTLPPESATATIT